MALMDRWMEKHCKVNWDTDPKKEADIRERQSIARAWNKGESIPRILDTHYLEPKYRRIKGEKEYANMVFDKSFQAIRCERPSVDDSILWMDRGTKEAIAITYNREDFIDEMEEYWSG